VVRGGGRSEDQNHPGRAPLSGLRGRGATWLSRPRQCKAAEVPPQGERQLLVILHLATAERSVGEGEPGLESEGGVSASEHHRTPR